MPNHITNILTVEGPQAATILSKYWEQEEDQAYGCLNLDKIVPQPELEGDDWYQWRIHHWGTKWNTYDGELYAPDECKFLTAWSSPLAAIVALSEKHPMCSFNVKYADEDFGYNTGIYECVNGKIIDMTPFKEGTEQAEDFAAEILGYDLREEEN